MDFGLGTSGARLGGAMSSTFPQLPSCRYRRLAGFAVLICVGLASSACQSSMSSSQLDAPGFDAAGGAEGSIKDTAEAGQAWRADPANIELGLSYAANLQALGQTADQIKVLDELARRNPDDARLQAYYGKQLTHHGRAADGERVLQRLVAAGQADWRVHSALGSALDQQGKFPQARKQYDIALQAGANRLTVLNNIGMSYMLEGNLKAAEATLREASSLPDGDSQPQVRQNLALAVGLQGRFDEARDIASRDLPPDTVEANLTYLRSMLSQPNTWQKLKPTAS
jgi:Flp pilus assembly protein TadD